MKKITNKTILKQGDKTYQPEEFGGMITWIDEYEGTIAQTKELIDGIPVISFDSYIERLCSNILQTELYDSNDKSGEYWRGDSVIRLLVKALNKNNPQKDIEKAIKLARKKVIYEGIGLKKYSNHQILEQINCISVIEVDEHFNILNYE